MDENLPLPEDNSLKLTDEDKSRINEIAGLIDTNDPNAIIQFGVGIQTKISEFADKTLSEVRARDTGHVGKILTDLIAKISNLKIDNLSGKAGVLSRIPLIGSLIDSSRKFMARYQDLSTQIVKIVEELSRTKVQLLQDVDMLNQFYNNNLVYFKEISLYILAGEKKLHELREKILPEMKNNIESSGDVMEAQRYKDLFQLTGRLDKKIHDLKLSRTVALHAAPQIRMVQNNNRELAEKIQSSILNTIPLWKHQMVIAITLLRQKQSLDLHKEVSETTRALLEKNAELLKTSSLDIASEAEKGIVDIETIKKVNASLISTIEDTIRIHREGIIKREEAEKELAKLESELREKLIEIRESSKTNRSSH